MIENILTRINIKVDIDKCECYLCENNKNTDIEHLLIAYLPLSIKLINIHSKVNISSKYIPHSVKLYYDEHEYFNIKHETRLSYAKFILSLSMNFFNNNDKCIVYNSIMYIIKNYDYIFGKRFIYRTIEALNDSKIILSKKQLKNIKDEMKYNKICIDEKTDLVNEDYPVDHSDEIEIISKNKKSVCMGCYDTGPTYLQWSMDEYLPLLKVRCNCSYGTYGY